MRSEAESGSATAPLRADISLDRARAIGPIDRRLFGGFVEHLGRHILTGIFEPGHPSADERGFRRDVIELVRGLGVSTVRYPGGNFVSGFRWEDGVGPRDRRPRRLDLAWHSTETNEVGLHEFAEWLEEVGGELMLALNLGTRGELEALDLMEYVRIRGGTARSEERAVNGRREPFDVRMWCLGNEMDGPWQLGHRSAEEYGRLAASTARAMRRLEPEAQLVVCGSSGSSMPTFGAWERTVLRHAYDEVDFISCHAYYEERDGDLASFLASAVDMDRFIERVVDIADEVGAERGSDKRIMISFDEWNVWYLERFRDRDTITGIDDWPVAPRLLEDVYSAADAVVVGGLLISLLRHADRVRSASLAQLVNVIAPIMTEPGGPAWRQTTFHPFSISSAIARGVALDVAVQSPAMTTAQHGVVDVVDAVAAIDGDDAAVLAVNRSPHDPVVLRVDAGEWAGRAVRARMLGDADLSAANTRDEPDRVVPVEVSCRRQGASLEFDLPPACWIAIELGAPARG